MPRRFGWKGIREGPAEHGNTHSYPKDRRYSNKMMGYAGALRKQGYSKGHAILFYKRMFGRDSPNSSTISRWYITRIYNPDAHSRASSPGSTTESTTDSTPDTEILGSPSGSDGEGRSPFQEIPLVNHYSPVY